MDSVIYVSIPNPPEFNDTDAIMCHGLGFNKMSKTKTNDADLPTFLASGFQVAVSATLDHNDHTAVKAEFARILKNFGTFVFMASRNQLAVTDALWKARETMEATAAALDTANSAPSSSASASEVAENKITNLREELRLAQQEITAPRSLATGLSAEAIAQIQKGSSSSSHTRHQVRLPRLRHVLRREQVQMGGLAESCESFRHLPCRSNLPISPRRIRSLGNSSFVFAPPRARGGCPPD